MLRSDCFAAESRAAADAGRSDRVRHLRVICRGAGHDAYTNPITIVPLYLIAYEIGGLTLGTHGLTKPPALPEWQWTNMLASMEAMGRWMMSLGAPLALGLLLLASMLAALGYVTVRGVWSVYLRRAWRARRHRVRA